MMRQMVLVDGPDADMPLGLVDDHIREVNTFRSGRPHSNRYVRLPDADDQGRAQFSYQENQAPPAGA